MLYESGDKIVYNVYPFTFSNDMQKALVAMNPLNSRARINNETDMKDRHPMQTPLFHINEHINYVNTKRLQQARQAELIRIARAGQPTPVSRFISSIRQVSGRALVAIGQKLQHQPANWAARELDAMNVTRTQASSS